MLDSEEYTLYHNGMVTMLARDKKQILIRVKPDTRKALRRIAAENDLSLSATVEKLIEESLFKTSP